MGFRLERNPFCIPFPMEEGAQLFSDKVLDPQHVGNGALSSLTQDFIIGGMSLVNMSKKYIYNAPVPTSLPMKSKSAASGRRDNSKLASPYSIPQKVGAQFLPGAKVVDKDSFLNSPLVKNAKKLASMHLSEIDNMDLTVASRLQSPDKFSSTANNTGILNNSNNFNRTNDSVVVPSPMLAGTAIGNQTGNSLMRQQVEESFVLNNDMLKIRQCELVILKEEEKYGPHKRDPEELSLCCKLILNYWCVNYPKTTSALWKKKLKRMRK